MIQLNYFHFLILLFEWSNKNLINIIFGQLLYILIFWGQISKLKLGSIGKLKKLQGSNYNFLKF